ncbi:MAG TPA: hypothetical protein DHV36_22310 [Desulfobacteraceae bacterium]|nr:hypothetical protein [Desulfobacteraceae bacterium]
MTTILIATLFLASVIGFGLLMNHLRQKGFRTKTSPIQTPAKPKEDPKLVYTKILDTLLKLNLMIRRDRHLSPAITLQVEKIIDDLKAVTPAMLERYPGETLTYEIKKIGNTHLYKTVKEYLDLSLESREQQLDVFTDLIDGLRDVCQRSRIIVEKNETQEFKTMALFLSNKFS